MKQINNIQEFSASIYAKSPLFKADTIEESYAKYVAYEEKQAEKASKKTAKRMPKFAMADLKANRVAIISQINNMCDAEMVKVVMQKMVDMVNEGDAVAKNIFALVSKAIDALESEGVKVLSNAKMNALEDTLRAKSRNEQIKAM